MVAPSKNGEQFNPKSTEVNRLTTTSGLSFLISSTHKNHKKSRYLSRIPIFKKADLISLIIPYLYNRNRISRSNILGNKQDPVSKQLFKDGPLTFELASQTIRNTVVSFFFLITSLCGK